MTGRDWFAIILIASLSTAAVMAIINDVFKRLDELEKRLISRAAINEGVLERIEGMMSYLYHTMPSEETEKPEKPYVGEVKLIDIHGDEWHGQLRKTNKVPSGYLFELYSDNGVSVCTNCFRYNNWEGREE